ncbi:uncharacterized protein LOC135086807 isoform X2 [Ostrinia nubilalis]|uniref:uncharacterized protein LOC114360356 isoform X2 n=1 Tax=Ostrinia furnacalis TaxID=93504 RepID=UPI0010394227|nr:uncharacterized protein LOC114360356 isoform X2 [Ostrinia furnacalis]
MYPDSNGVMCLLVSLALISTAEAFFLKWASDSTPAASQKTWMQQPSPYRYQYVYSPYESRKIYQPQQLQYAQPEAPMPQNMAPIPINVPAGTSLTPVSLQRVQLVPCMCPIAPEDAEKVQEVGPAPYLAQTYTYSAPQKKPVDNEDHPNPQR